MTDFWYPSVEDVLTIHEEIVTEYAETSPGVNRRGDIEFALQYIEEGHFRSTPETIHAKAYHLLRLPVANHPFADANKRTALNTTAVVYLLNGYQFKYDEEMMTILKQFGIDEASVDSDEVISYLETHTEFLDLLSAIEDWREDLIQYGLGELSTGGYPND